MTGAEPLLIDTNILIYANAAAVLRLKGDWRRQAGQLNEGARYIEGDVHKTGGGESR